METTEWFLTAAPWVGTDATAVGKTWCHAISDVLNPLFERSLIVAVPWEATGSFWEPPPENQPFDALILVSMSLPSCSATVFVANLSGNDFTGSMSRKTAM